MECIHGPFEEGDMLFEDVYKMVDCGFAPFETFEDACYVLQDDA